MSDEIQDGNCGILVVELHELISFGIVREKEHDPRALLLEHRGKTFMLEIG